MSEIKQVPAAEVILDFDLYPRNDLDSHNVRRIVESMQAGIEMPPIIRDQKSHRCVDGFHRLRAAIRLYGDNSEVSVIDRTYKNEAEIFLDAMRLNASHGVGLDPFDRTRCVILGDKLKLTLDQIAGALNMTTQSLGKLRETRTAMAGSLRVPLKQGISKMFNNRRLTKQQAETNERLSGMNPLFHVNQLVMLIQADMLDLENENLIKGLQKLHALLDRSLRLITA
jgi:hypothetical protein